MKRDMDLIRELLLFHAGELTALSETDKDKINFHKYLLIDANFAVGNSLRLSNGYLQNVIISNLKWDGYDFLENIREKSNWETIKEKASKLGSFAVPVIQRLAADLILSGIKAHI